MYREFDRVIPQAGYLRDTVCVVDVVLGEQEYIVVCCDGRYARIGEADLVPYHAEERNLV